MKKYLPVFIIVVAIFFFASPSKAFAAVKCWHGSAGANWNVDANWVTNLGGATTQPGVGDIATFDSGTGQCSSGAQNTNVTIPSGVSISVAGINMTSNYTQTITQTTTATITVGSSGWVQAGGTFTGGSGAITINDSATSGSGFSLSGGTFTSTTGNLTVGWNFTISSGTFTHNSGTVVFDAGLAGTPTLNATATFNNLTFSPGTTGPTWTFTSGKTLTVNGTLTFNSTTNQCAFVGTGALVAKGNITTIGLGCSAAITGVSTPQVDITISGTGNQTITGENDTDTSVPGIIVNKSTGNLTISNEIVVTDIWTMTSMGSGSFITTGSTVRFAIGNASSETLTGSTTFNNLDFSNINGNGDTLTIASGTTLTATGTVTMNSTVNGTTLNGPGTLEIQGDLATGSLGVGGNAAMTVSGSANQTFTTNGSSTPSGTVTFNKSGGTVTLSGTVGFNQSGQDVIIQTGTTLTLGGTGTLLINDQLTVSGTLVQGAASVTAGISTGTFNISSGGTWTNTSTGDLNVGPGGIANNGTLILDGTSSGCGGADAIAITKDSTTPSWTGSGSFTLYDLAMDNQSTSLGIPVWSSTDNGSNTGFNFTTKTTCPAAATLFWKFEEGSGTTVKDSSGAVNTGTLGGATIPTWQTDDQCINGKCLYFDGSSSKVTGSAVVSSVQSVSLWIRPIALNSTNALINLDGGTHKITSNSSGTLTATGFSSPTIYVNGISGGTLTLNKWNFVEVTTATSFNTSASFTVGTDGTNYTKGFFDEVRFFPSVRTAAQVKADYNSKGTVGAVSEQIATSINNNPNALSNGLVGYWKMDESNWLNTTNTPTVVQAANSNPACAGGSGVDITANFASNVTGGDTIIAIASWGNETQSGADANMGDGGSDSFTHLKTIGDSTNQQSLALYYTASGSSGGFKDVTFKGSQFSNACEGLVVYEVSGLITSSSDTGVSNPSTSPHAPAGGSSSSNGDTTGSFTTNTNGELIFAAFMDTVALNGGAFTAGTSPQSFTIPTNGSTTANLIMAGEFAVQTSAGSINPAITKADAGNYLAIGWGFKPVTSTAASADGSGNSNSGTPSGLTGTVSSSTTTVITVSGTPYTTNAFAGDILTMTSGAQNNLQRTISSNTTNTITLSSALGGAPSNGNTFKITPNTGTGKFGYGGVFNGVSDYLDVGTNSSVNLTGALTISAWVKPSSATFTNQGCIVCNIDATGDTDGFEFYFDSSSDIHFDYYNGTFTHKDWDITYSFIAGNWYHIVLTKTNTGTVAIYVNGTPYSVSISGNTATTEPSSGWGNTTIGEDGSSNSQYFAGTIDGVRIYNRALSPSDVSILYNFTPGPSEYWKMDDTSWTNNCSTSTVTDSSGTGANLTSCPNSTGPTAGAAGKYGKAASFDGSTQYFSGTVSPTLASNSFTISGWVNITTMQVNNDWLSIGTSTSSADNLIHMRVVNNGTFRFGFFSDDLDGSSSVSANTWYFISGTYDSTTRARKLYLNGSLLASDTAGANFAGTTTINIGRSNIINNYFAGKVDDVRIYNYPRTQKQVVEDMNAGHPAPGSPVGSPVAWWKFNEGYGTTVNNSGNQGSSLAGTMSNFSSPSTSTSGWTTSGKFGKALIFDGTTGTCTSRCDDSINAGSDSSIDDLTANPMSLSAWIYPNTIGEGSQGVIMAKNSGATPSSGWLWQMTATNALKFSVDGTTDLVRTTSNNAITMGAWNYVTLTWDGTFTDASTVHVYVNGIETSYQTTTNGASRVSDAASSLFIGNDSSGASTFDGKIDEVKIYNGQLTSDQVKLDMNRGQAQQVGALSQNTNISDPGTAASQEYCVPGDTNTSCSGPAGEWKFEDMGATAADTSGNANDLTWTGSSTTRYASGKVGKAATFTAANLDDISVGDVSALDLTGAVTVSAWVKFNSLSATRPIIAKYTGTLATSQYSMSVNSSGNLSFTVVDSGCASFAQAITTNAPISTNTWYHVTGVYSPSTSVSVYINGVLANQNTTSIPASLCNTSTSFVIGGNGAGTLWMDGLIDQARVYNYARSVAQIAWDYNHGGPVAWYKMDECTGTTIHDSSGNGLSGTLTIGGTGSYTSAGTCSSGTSTDAWYHGNNGLGKYNYSIGFDGTNDYLSLPNDAKLRSSQGTFAAWVKTTTDTDEELYGATIGAATSDQFSLELGNNTSSSCTNGLITLFTGNGTGPQLAFTSANRNLLFDGNWHHIAVTVDGTSTKIYLDGLSRTVTVCSGSDTAVFTNDSSFDNFRIGSIRYNGTNTNFLNGQVDDARLYNYALTATQIKQVYNNGAANFAPATGLP